VAYLVILVVVAAAGIFRLWLQQRRERSQMETIEGFNTALEKISPDTPIPLPKKAATRRSRRASARAARSERRRATVSQRRNARRERHAAAVARRNARHERRAAAVSGRADRGTSRRRVSNPQRRRAPRPAMTSGTVSSMDSPRRAAARRRIEARRRARAVG
jgi:hypothetical protein